MNFLERLLSDLPNGLMKEPLGGMSRLLTHLFFSHRAVTSPSAFMNVFMAPDELKLSEDLTVSELCFTKAFPGLL